jgi:hypothetical protein
MSAPSEVTRDPKYSVAVLEVRYQEYHAGVKALPSSEKEVRQLEGPIEEAA